MEVWHKVTVFTEDWTQFRSNTWPGKFEVVPQVGDIIYNDLEDPAIVYKRTHKYVYQGEIPAHAYFAVWVRPYKD